MPPGGNIPRVKRLAPAADWQELISYAGRLEGGRPRAARHHARPAAPHQGLRGDGARAGRRGPGARARALLHRPGGRRRRLHREPALDRRGQRLAPRPPPVPRQGAHPRHQGLAHLGRPGHPGGRRGAAAHPRGDPRPGPGVLRRPRRLHAPAVAGGRRARHQRHRRRRRADGGRQLLGAEELIRAGGQRPDRHVLRRRRGQHRVGARDAEPGVGLEAAAVLLHGEQRLRGLHHRRGGHRRAPAVGPRPRLRHHRLAGRRHGPAGGAPGHGAGRGAAARRAGPGRRRGARLPVLPPERPVPRAPRSATGPRRKKRDGAPATRWTGSRAR